MIRCNPCIYFIGINANNGPTPRIVGHLKRQLGFNHYHPILQGSYVYEDKKGYYLEQTLISTGQVQRIYWYKDSAFINDILFI